MELRLLVYGGPPADHSQGHGVTARLKSLSVHPLFDIAFSVSARAAAAGPFDFTASSGLKQLLCVADCPDAAGRVFSHMPVRILSCACSAVAALSARHITAGITFVLSDIWFLSGVRFSVVRSGSNVEVSWQSFRARDVRAATSSVVL
jgi:hypothetical protein